MNVTPTADGTIVVSTSGRSLPRHLRGLLNQASNSASSVYDSTRPIATWDALPGPISGNGTDLTLRFSEPVTGLTIDDFGTTLVSVSQLTGGPSVWTVRIAPASTDGAFQVTLPANRCTDLAGNQCLGASITGMVDRTGPVISLNYGSHTHVAHSPVHHCQ